MAARRSPAVSPLEWFAAALGALIAIGLLALIGFEAATGPNGGPPDLVVEAERPVPVRAGHVVPISVRNLADATAAVVEIVGGLMAGGSAVETSAATVDYVPGGARRRAALMFARDPAARPLNR